VSRRMPTAVVSMRVDEVYELVVHGVRTYKIHAHAKTEWGVCARTANHYIAVAKERLEEESKVKRRSELGKALARLDNQYMKADLRQDHRGAVIAEHERIELLGLRVSAEGDRDELRRFLDFMEGVE